MISRLRYGSAVRCAAESLDLDGTMMDTTGSENFDYCAEIYTLHTELDIVAHCDYPTMVQLVGDLRGKTCLDLGCGDGVLTRLIQQQNQADRLVAVDISDKMIELAIAEEEREPLGIVYQVGDINTLDLSEQFDCVVVSFLLSIAHHRNNLRTMLERIFAHLKPGGTMVVMDDNLFLEPHHYTTLNSINITSISA